MRRVHALLLLVAGTVIGCRSGASSPAPTSTAPTPISGTCAFVIEADKFDNVVSADGSTVEITVTTLPACRWNFSYTGSVWVTNVGRTDFYGTGTMRFSVKPNPGPERHSTVTVIGFAQGNEYSSQSIQIRQEAINAPPPTTPSFFWLNSIERADNGAGYTGALTSREADFTAIMLGDRSVSIVVAERGGAARRRELAFGAPEGPPLRVGVYENAGRGTPGFPFLDFHRSEVSSCGGETWGRFAVTELQTTPVNGMLYPRLDRLHMTFEYRCYRPDAPPDYGEVWYVRN